jgi:hypothetical protein
VVGGAARILGRGPPSGRETAVATFTGTKINETITPATVSYQVPEDVTQGGIPEVVGI